MKLKKFKIIATGVTEYEAIVVAKDKNEAMDKAKLLDTSEWIESRKLTYVDEVFE